MKVPNYTDKINVIVVGVGYLGRYHALKYMNMKGVELLGVVDIDPQRAREVALESGTRAFTDMDGIRPLPRAASIASSTTSHYPLVKRLINSGVHIIVEKPMTDNLKAAGELVDLAREKGVILQVGHVERFNPVFKELKNRVSYPGFVEMHRLSPVKKRSLEIDVVFDMMIHDIDILLAFNPGKIVSIDAMGVRVISSSIDIANVRMRFDTGCVANITASRVSDRVMRKVRVFQRDIYISGDLSEQRISIFKRDNKGDGGIPGIAREDIGPFQVDPLSAELSSFIECIRNRRAPIFSGEDALPSLEIALNIKEQIKDKAFA